MGKFTDWIRTLFGRDAQADEDYVHVSASEHLPPSEPAFSPKRSWLTKWTPGAQRERQIAWLQAGYSEMLNLMRGIHAHLERQEDVQHKLVAALEQLPASLDNLKNLGKAAEQQVEALALLRDQLARSGQHDQQLADSMNRFNQTLGLLDETARASGRTVEELIAQAREEDRLLHELVRRSERRFAAVASLFVLVLLALLGAGVYLLLPRRPSVVTVPAAGTVANLATTPESMPEQIPASPSNPVAATVSTSYTPAPAIDQLQQTISAEPSTDSGGQTTEALTNAEPREADVQPPKPRKARRSLLQRRSKSRPATFPREPAARTNEVAP